MDSEELGDSFNAKVVADKLGELESKVTFKSFTYTLEDEETLETTDETGKLGS